MENELSSAGCDKDARHLYPIEGEKISVSDGMERDEKYDSMYSDMNGRHIIKRNTHTNTTVVIINWAHEWESLYARRWVKHSG